jgi:hypothetical protein
MSTTNITIYETGTPSDARKAFAKGIAKLKNDSQNNYAESFLILAERVCMLYPVFSIQEFMRMNATLELPISKLEAFYSIFVKECTRLGLLIEIGANCYDSCQYQTVGKIFSRTATI